MPPAVIVCIHARFTGSLRFRELIEVGEDQLALAPGVTGVDDVIDVLAREQLLERVEALLRILDRLEAEFFRNDRQRLEPPEAVFLLVDVLRHLELHEVTDGGRDDVFVVFVVVALLRNFAERAREIGRNGLASRR